MRMLLALNCMLWDRRSNKLRGIKKVIFCARLFVGGERWEDAIEERARFSGLYGPYD